MYNLVLTIHVIVSIALIGIILIQRGRSGGLIEALGGVESIFGTKTSSFFVKITVGLAITFFIASISLAYLSKQRGKSLIKEGQSVPSETTTPTEETTTPTEETTIPTEETTTPTEELPAP